MRWTQRGQVTAEMAVLFSFVVAALVFMGVYIQRGAQGGVKGNVDSIGQQFSTSTAWKSVSKSKQHQDAAEKVFSSQCADYEHVLADFNKDGILQAPPALKGVECEAVKPHDSFNVSTP